MNYIIDTSAWIEYIKGSKKGEVLKKIFENNTNKVITLECSIAEIRLYCIRNNYKFEEAFNLIKTNSFIFSILLETWLEAARIKSELRKNRPGFGIIDALLIAKQKENNAKLVSKDSHFKSLKNVIYIGD